MERIFEIEWDDKLHDPLNGPLDIDADEIGASLYVYFLIPFTVREIGKHTMTKQIVDQKQRMAAECQWWKELYELADREDVAGFYQHYAKYLEWKNVINGETGVLHRMGILVGKVLKTAQDSPVPLFQNEDREEE